MRTAPVEIDTAETYNAVIPGKSLIELSKILDDSNESS